LLQQNVFESFNSEIEVTLVPFKSSKISGSGDSATFDLFRFKINYADIKCAIISTKKQPELIVFLVEEIYDRKVLLQSFRTTDNIKQFICNSLLALLIVLDSQFAKKIIRIIRRYLHGYRTSRLLGCGRIQ
jgi:hypothetical protein